MGKIQKIKSKYEVHLPTGEVIEFETLELAEKKLKSLKGMEYEYYFIRKDYKGQKLEGEYLIS
jgi:hypothetical protein